MEREPPTNNPADVYKKGTQGRFVKVGSFLITPWVPLSRQAA